MSDEARDKGKPPCPWCLGAGQLYAVGEDGHPGAGEACGHCAGDRAGGQDTSGGGSR